MKKILILILLIQITNSVNAQLVLTPGAQLFVSGNGILTLNNADLVNNGTLNTGNSTISFTGNGDASISGAQPIQFYILQVSKSGGGAVMLQRSVGVSEQINFIGNVLNLNNHDLDLGSTGILSGENENSHIIGSAGGQVLRTATLNAPSAANPGNLGAIITSGQNLGTVTISRGHQSQTESLGSGSSILRYYDIVPQNNSNINATLRFAYFDSELNGLAESDLVLYKSANTTNWMNQGFTTRDTSANYVEKTGISSFSRWTLSGAGNPLPLTIGQFNSTCDKGKVTLKWQTLQESNSSHFEIQASLDGINWTAIGKVNAAGNSTLPIDYTFTYENQKMGYYRFIAYDIDGSSKISKIVQSACRINNEINIWPNPVQSEVNITLHMVEGDDVFIQLYDAKGTRVKSIKNNLFAGKNQVVISVADLPSGIYQVVINSAKNGKISTHSMIKK